MIRQHRRHAATAAGGTWRAHVVFFEKNRHEKKSSKGEELATVTGSRVENEGLLDQSARRIQEGFVVS